MDKAVYTLAAWPVYDVKYSGCVAVMSGTASKVVAGRM